MLKFKKHDNDKEKSDSKKESNKGSRSPSPKRSSRSRYSRSPSPKRSSRSRYSRSPSPKRSYRSRYSRSPSPSRRHGRYSPLKRRSPSPSRRRDDNRDSKRRSRSPPRTKLSENKGVKKVLKQQPTYSLIQVEVNDRLGKKVRVKCAPNDLVGDFKKLVAAQIGTEPSKIVLKKWYKEYKDHITLADYEIHDGMNLELYYR